MTHKILVVDDEPWVVDSVRSYLEQAHFEVLIAYDGPTAVSQFEAHHPDLVILDWMLPALDGLSVASRIRSTGTSWLASWCLPHPPSTTSTWRNRRRRIIPLSAAGGKAPMGLAAAAADRRAAQRRTD